MRTLWFSLFCISVCFGAFSEDVFSENLLKVEQNCVRLVSSFDKVDYLTTTDRAGGIIWEIPFSSKIISWELSDDLIFVFSESRKSPTYYLSCLDALTGEVKWEKQILPPQESSSE